MNFLIIRILTCVLILTLSCLDTTLSSSENVTAEEHEPHEHEFEVSLVGADDEIDGSKPKFEGKIVGGDPVPIERYPFAVLIFNMGSLCAGSILNSYAVLSAAHCFVHNDDVYEMSIHVGARHRYDSKAQIYDVEHLITHENYDKEMAFACDIAMLFTHTKIAFSNRVQRAIIVDSEKWKNKYERNFTVTGWGMIKYNGPVSSMGLMMTSLRYVPIDECGELHSMTFTKDMFCLYGDAKRDTCKGDSGGGVLWNGMLVGIVSHGDGCAGKDKPSVYSNVYYFRKWINKKMVAYAKLYCKTRANRRGKKRHVSIYRKY